MSRPKTEYQGVICTDQYLTVFFKQETGTSVRFSEIKVPLADLEKAGLVNAIDGIVRRRLILAWAASQEMLPTDERPPWDG